MTAKHDTGPKRPPPPADAEESVRKQEQRKRRKKEKLLAMRSGEWDRCMFLLPRKQRYCNMTRVTGSEFCGHHIPTNATVTSKKAQQFDATKRNRVPCPLDGSHTVYEYDLEKHLKVCNKRRQLEAMRELPYFCENINSGSHAQGLASVIELVKTETTVQDDEHEARTGGPEGEHEGPTAQEAQSLIDKLAAMNFAAFVKKIEAVYEQHVGEIPLAKLHHPCCDGLLKDKADAGSTKNVLRHIEQQASIIGHMERVKLLDPEAAYVELGAGRGMLSLALAQALPDSQFVLIDRGTSRGKADHTIRDGATTQESRKLLRARIDIRHLNLAGIPELANVPVVGISKHLCGVATDLSLRSLQTLPRTAITTTTNASSSSSCPQPETEDTKPRAFSDQLRGLAIALCCHHVCCWEDYVNPEFILAQGFAPHEFALLTNMTSWATCMLGPGGDSVERVLGITKPARAALGRKCKRILDAGRVQYLRARNVNAELVHYCEVDDSVENCLLLAWR